MKSSFQCQIGRSQNIPGSSLANGRILYISACRPGCKTRTERERCEHSYTRLLSRLRAQAIAHAEAGHFLRPPVGEQPLAPNICYHLLLPTEFYPQRRTLRAVDTLAVSFDIKRTRGNRHETVHKGL